MVKDNITIDVLHVKVTDAVTEISESGISPEDFFRDNDCPSARKTRNLELNRAPFGTSEACIGVIEDQTKGTLHYHLLFLGDLSPILPKRFSSKRDV
jgi:hypothetical protein